MSRFADKVVIVTGSSAGIGKAVIHGFAKEGASVVLHGTNAERLAAAEKALLDADIPATRILKIQGELTEDATHDKIINETIARFGKINVLVNNAGVFKLPGGAETATENFDYVFAVNVENGYEGTVYGMSKAAVDRFTKNVNQSLMKKGIRINNINPGPFESNIQQRAIVNATDEERTTFDKIREKLTNVITPAGRRGRAEELVPIFLLLADEKSSFITGATWVIDGGMGTWAPEATDLKL